MSGSAAPLAPPDASAAASWHVKYPLVVTGVLDRHPRRRDEHVIITGGGGGGGAGKVCG